MALEPIRITHPVDSDRAEVEQRVVRGAERDPERFLTAYAQQPGGARRAVCMRGPHERSYPRICGFDRLTGALQQRGSQHGGRAGVGAVQSAIALPV